MSDLQVHECSSQSDNIRYSFAGDSACCLAPTYGMMVITREICEV